MAHALLRVVSSVLRRVPHALHDVVHELGEISGSHCNLLSFELMLSQVWKLALVSLPTADAQVKVAGLVLEKSSVEG